MRIAFTFMLFIAASQSFSQDRDDAIRSLLNETGSGKLAMQMLDIMIPQMQKMFPQVPTEVWQEFKGKIDVEEFIDLIVPIYKDHYSEDEIQQLIEFYKTPMGQKIVKEAPAIQQESYAAGQEWGRSIAEDMIQSLKRKGYEPQDKDGT